MQIFCEMSSTDSSLIGLIQIESSVTTRMVHAGRLLAQLSNQVHQGVINSCFEHPLSLLGEQQLTGSN